MTTHTSVEPVQWDIPAAYVREAPDYRDARYGEVGTKNFILLAVDLATIEPWTIAHGQRSLWQVTGHGGAEITVTGVGNRKDPDFNLHWDGARANRRQDTETHWRRTGHQLFGMEEFRGPISSGPGNHQTRLLPPAGYEGHVIFVDCIGNNDDGAMKLDGCAVNSFMSRYYAVEYRLWSTDLPALEEIDGKIRGLLHSFVRWEPAPS